MSDEQTTSGCHCAEFAGIMRTSFLQALYNDMWLHFGQMRTPPYTGLVTTPGQCTGAIMNKDLGHSPETWPEQGSTLKLS